LPQPGPDEYRLAVALFCLKDQMSLGAQAHFNFMPQRTTGLFVEIISFPAHDVGMPIWCPHPVIAIEEEGLL
jgi:hypothetical protein